MRLLIDSLIAVMLIGILAGLVLHHRSQQQHAHRLRQVHLALAQLHQQALYHAALRRPEHDPIDPARDAGFPQQIQRDWFPDGLPINPLAGVDRPWIDVAPPDDTAAHPPDPVLDSPDQAGFWYNPTVGTIRARVPRQVSEHDTLDLYNHLNGTALTALPRDDTPRRLPIAAQPITPTTVAHAADADPSADPSTAPSADTGDTQLDRPRPTLLRAATP